MFGGGGGGFGGGGGSLSMMGMGGQGGSANIQNGLPGGQNPLSAIYRMPTYYVDPYGRPVGSTDQSLIRLIRALLQSQASGGGGGQQGMDYRTLAQMFGGGGGGVPPGTSDVTTSRDIY